MASPKATRLRRLTLVRPGFARHPCTFRMGQERQISRSASHLSGPLRYRSRPRLGHQQHQCPRPIGSRQRKLSPKPIRFVSPDDFRRLIAATPHPWWKAFLSVAYAAGTRVREAVKRLRPLEQGLLAAKPSLSGQSRGVHARDPALVAAVDALVQWLRRSRHRFPQDSNLPAGDGAWGVQVAIGRRRSDPQAVQPHSTVLRPGPVLHAGGPLARASAHHPVSARSLPADSHLPPLSVLLRARARRRAPESPQPYHAGEGPPAQRSAERWNLSAIS